MFNTHIIMRFILLRELSKVEAAANVVLFFIDGLSCQRLQVFLTQVIHYIQITGIKLFKIMYFPINI